MKSRRNKISRGAQKYAGKDRLMAKYIRKINVNAFSLYHSSDFSAIENSNAAVKEIQKLVSQAGLAAASEAKAIGIPRVYARNNKIIREYADGRIEVVSSITQKEKAYFKRLKSGVLHARKK